jgi:hypothetical protein
MIKAGYYEDVITVEDGLLFRTVIAHWAATRRRDGGCHAVYRIDENGKEYCRALMYSCYSGYRIDETELKNRKWYSPGISLDLFKFGRYEQLRSFYGTDAERICRVHPDFKYVVQKAGEMPVAKMFNILIAWKKNHNVELLVGANLDYLALNKSFAKLTKLKQKAVLNFIRVTPGADGWSLSKINFVMNKKGTPEDFDAWQKFRPLSKVVDYRWFKKYGANKDKYILYIDYMQMAKYCGHDMKEDYWKYPKSIKKAHDKVMKQYRLILEAEAIAAKKARAKEAREKERNFKKFAGAFCESVSRACGLVAYIPQTFGKVSEHAKALHQCLTYADYTGKMAKRDCLLVFVADVAGHSVATAEIAPNGNVVQFYADEDREKTEDMKPTAEAQTVLEKWLKDFGKDAVKAMKKVA